MTLPIILITKSDIFFPKIHKTLLLENHSSKAVVDHALRNDKKVAFLFEKERVAESQSDFYKYSVVGEIVDLNIQKNEANNETLYKVDFKIIERIMVPDISELEKEKVLVLDDYIPYVELNNKVSVDNILELAQNIKYYMSQLSGRYQSLCFDEKYLTTQSINDINSVETYLNEILTGLKLNNSLKYDYLKELSLERRLFMLLEYLKEKYSFFKEIEKIDNRIEEKRTEEDEIFLLKEKIKDYQKELDVKTGEGDKEHYQEDDVEELDVSERDKIKLRKEIRKSKSSLLSDDEKSKQFEYLDLCFSLPFNHKTPINKDLKRSKEILDNEHYGALPVKNKIIENIAFQNVSKNNETPIMCLVGPPGVGKTSFGNSIANATGRELVRISLGGVENEAEIRGHRRTYVGAKVGRIIEALKEVNVKNPLILLDEIDKMEGGKSSKVSSALLEVLDPKQNKAFRDNFLEIGFDLSEVMFVATANSLNMPEPLMDRMEIVALRGYTEKEKIHIAQKHTIPKILSKLTIENFNIEGDALSYLINNYTQEAGVREMERVVNSFIGKKIKRAMLEDKNIEEEFFNKTYNIEDIKEDFGPTPYRTDKILKDDKVGIVNGLAWSSHGGEILKIETVRTPGSGKMSLTGHLGDVMKESAQAALTIIKSQYPDVVQSIKENDLHIHLPEGSIPKDGPSAGVGIAVSIISAMTSKKIKKDIAMTGEVSLSGDVLGVGGVKEKLLAAVRSGVKTVIIPKENIDDISEISDEIKEKIEVVSIEKIEEAVNIALLKDK